MKKMFYALLTLLSLTTVSVNGQGWQWATGSSCPHVSGEGMAIAADSNGNTYSVCFAWAASPPAVLTTIFGSFTVVDTGYNNMQTIIVSNDSNGHYRWTIGLQHGKEIPVAIKTDKRGDVYVLVNCSITGEFTIGATTFYGSYAIIKLTGAGAVTWVRPLPYVYGSIVDFDVSSTMDIYVTGYYATNFQTLGTDTLFNNDTVTTTIAHYDAFLAKYDSSLNYRWARNIGGTLDDHTRRIATYDTFAFVTGTYASPSVIIGTDTLTNSSGGSITSVFEIKYSQSGMPVWAVNPFSDSTLYVTDIVADKQGSTYITGTFFGGIRFAADTLAVASFFGLNYLFKYDKNGVPQWARTVRTYGFSTPHDMAIDKCGNIWITGGEPITGIVNPLFLLHYDTAGVIYDTLEVASGGDDMHGIALDGKGNLYLCADYNRTISIGSNTLLADSSDEAFFVARYKYGSGCQLSGHEHDVVSDLQLAAGKITLFPNPAYGTCTIASQSGFPDNSKAVLYDMSSRLIGSFPLSGTSTVLDINNITPGLYIIKINSGTNAPAGLLKLVITE